MSLKKEKDIHNFITCIVILGQVNIVLMAVIFSFAIKLKLNFRSEVKGKFDNWILVAMFVKMFALGIAFRNHNKPYVKPNSEILSISKKDWTELAEEILKLFLKNSLFIKKQV